MTNEFTPPAPLQTAVLFLVFNRPDTTAQVFEAIRQAKPPRLYVAADGPREGREGEAERVAKVREIATAVDWPCEVQTLFREENLGCKYAVSGAITWFFEQEEQGVILEDDCLPSQSFFWFCEELLFSYKDIKRVGMISGNNLFNEKPTSDSPSFFFSYGNIWGWATWRDRWDKYMQDISPWDEKSKKNLIKEFFIFQECANHYSRVFEDFLEKDLDTWDIPWLFARLKNKLLTINPSVNLVANIGFGPEATHTFRKSDQISCLESCDIPWPLSYPEKIAVNEKYVRKQCARPFKSKIKSFIKRVLQVKRII